MSDLDRLAGSLYGASAAPSKAASPQPTAPTDERLAQATYDKPSAAAPAATPAKTEQTNASEFSTDRLARGLYGDSKATEDAKPAPDAQASQEEALRPEVPDNVKALRDGQVERKVYSPQKTFADAITEDVFNAPEITPEVRAVATAEIREMFADAGLNAQEAKEFVTLAKQLAAEPPSPERELEMQQEAVQRVIDANGGDREAARADLELARKLVARDPRVGRLLDITRLGNDPRVIATLIQKARAERIAGRLK
jgi:hypothetical protein